jgi:hypothetical protein
MSKRPPADPLRDDDSDSEHNDPTDNVSEAAYNNKKSPIAAPNSAPKDGNTETTSGTLALPRTNNQRQRIELYGFPDGSVEQLGIFCLPLDLSLLAPELQDTILDAWFQTSRPRMWTNADWHASPARQHLWTFASVSPAFHIEWRKRFSRYFVTLQNPYGVGAGAFFPMYDIERDMFSFHDSEDLFHWLNHNETMGDLLNRAEDNLRYIAVRGGYVDFMI